MSSIYNFENLQQDMSITGKLASSLGRNDEAPNIELANVIAAAEDKAVVKELVALLAHKSKDWQNDSIKVLYEIGAIKPMLIAGYLEEFVRLLDTKNNRLQWGLMTATNTIVAEKPGEVFEYLPVLATAVEKGSVITRDNYVAILVKLYTVPKYADDAFALLKEQLLHCPANQLPMYAENAAPVINVRHKPAFISALQSRLDEFEKESKKKRVEKVLKKIA